MVALADIHIHEFVLKNEISEGKGKGGREKKSISSSAKAGLQFPVGRIGRYRDWSLCSQCHSGGTSASGADWPGADYRHLAA